MEKSRLRPETLKDMASFEMLLGLSPSEIGIMASVMSEVTMPKNTYFIFEDSNDFEVFFILKGQAEIRVPRNSGGGNGRLALVGPGETVGEFALARYGRRSASTCTISDVVALKASSEELHKLFAEHPNIGYHIYRNLLRLTVERLEDTNFLARKVV
jgi:CRP-like cAMP-binding protein